MIEAIPILLGVATAVTAGQPGFELVSGYSVRKVACYARSSRGTTFEAVGDHAPETEERALNKCYRMGEARCYSVGCHIVYVREGD